MIQDPQKQLQTGMKAMGISHSLYSIYVQNFNFRSAVPPDILFDENKYERYYRPGRCPLAYLLYYILMVRPACA